MMRVGSSAGGAVYWAAAGTALSALLYLFDIGTTLSALRSYFYYQCLCPYVPQTSSAYLHDPVCQSIHDQTQSFHEAYIVFWLCLLFLALAHLTYAFIFWLTLHPRLHPLRLAYFMPLIHLHRLLKVLWHTCSCKDLKELQESQKESSSLYNVLGASLETAPQFVIQFLIAMKLGQSLEGSSDVHVFRAPEPIPPELDSTITPALPPYVTLYFDFPGTEAVRIPTNLILSLVASAMSGTYCASMAVLFLIEQQDIPLARRACVGILAGFQTLVVMLLQATLTAALSQFSDYGSITLLIYVIMTLIMAWSFSTFMLRSNYNDWQGKSKFLNAAYSLALAYMSIFTGPIYMIVKFGKSSCWLIGATLLHIFGELIGVALVLFRPGAIKDRQSPCHSHPYIATNYAARGGSLDIMNDIYVQEENKYLTCNVFLGTIFPLLFTFILTTMLFVWVHMRTASTNTVGNNHNQSKASSSTLSLVQSSKGIKKKSSCQRNPPSSFFKNFLFAMLINFIERTRKHMYGRVNEEEGKVLD